MVIMPINRHEREPKADADSEEFSRNLTT